MKQVIGGDEKVGAKEHEPDNCYLDLTPNSCDSFTRKCVIATEEN